MKIVLQNLYYIINNTNTELWAVVALRGPGAPMTLKIFVYTFPQLYIADIWDLYISISQC